jgi:PAS domain S-box-containing protein
VTGIVPVARSRTPAGRDDSESVAVLESLPIGLAVVEAPDKVVWANPAFLRMTGQSAREKLLNLDRWFIGNGTDATEARRGLDAALRAKRSVTLPSVRAHLTDPPQLRFLDVEVRPLNHGPRSPHRSLLVLLDVTEREEEHQRARLFYESFRTSTNPMQLTDAKGIMVDVNPAYEKVYGYTRAECVGRRPNLVRSQHTPPEVYQQMWADLTDPQRGYWSGEILNRDRTGRERPVLLSITAIRTPAGEVTHYLGVAVDLSEQRSWELRAAHADKLASVGQLAAGVAHEINTPLANVMLVAESLRRRRPDPWMASRLDTMTEQVEVAARIVRSLLDFARREEPHVAVVDLVGVLRDSVAFLRGKQSADVEIEETYPSAPVEVAGDRGQLMQVFTNILNNAYDAMEGKGTIRISVRRHEGRAEVDIVDSGPGIPPEALPHVFEPFFTTKPEGQGTGLGLAICHGLIQSHHGTITGRNVPGAGAGFLTALPIAAHRPGAHLSPPAA